MFQVDETDDNQCFVKAKQRNQPTFTLVAQDELAPIAIMAWISAARACGASQEKIAQAEKDYATFVQWQKDNENKVKLPD